MTDSPCRQGDELTSSGSRQHPRLLARVGGLAGDELTVRRIGHDDGQTDLGPRTATRLNDVTRRMAQPVFLKENQDFLGTTTRPPPYPG